ncbi:dioxygenase [Paraburkholderia sp. CNPSo 3281]|uniref:dioxygenase family protein n=1 Tax=Paraburkholderia sp. CNPSo 3281 TaxID=2940933 RepID=UPI0020B7C29C|nr:dioxygenase [Paraburkholderia sp. CNPSo 3281]MCP3716053.1 catechol 1,2-dioxygenase [Paraburkholderia sp. CNPSo 3281]
MDRPVQWSNIVTDATSTTAVVLAAMEKTANPRLKGILNAVVRHAHAFLNEVKLTDDEFERGLDFIRRVGLTCTDSHNEVVLLADVLGLSTLVKVLNNAAHEERTGGALLGPFYRAGSPRYEQGHAIVQGTTLGPPLFVSGHVLDTNRQPIRNARVEVWQASPVGLYENQDPQQPEMNLRGHFFTDAQGAVKFRSVRPAGYPVPTQGPVGDLLRLQKRHPYRPAHLHFVVVAQGYATLISQIFADDAEYLDSDVVFGVTRDLVGEFERHEAGTGPHPQTQEPYYTLECVFVLGEGVSTYPTPPIK